MLESVVQGVNLLLDLIELFLARALKVDVVDEVDVCLVVEAVLQVVGVEELPKLLDNILILFESILHQVGDGVLEP